MRNTRDFGSRCARIRAFGDRVASRFKRQAQHVPQAIFVFDKQYVRHDGSRIQ
jgi:hypothetical protein